MRLTVRRDQLNQDLIVAQGAEAQTLARELGACSVEIEKFEDELLKKLEQLETRERKFASPD